jgi:ribosomal protein S18 acetylase RimI-like enzyme
LVIPDHTLRPATLTDLRVVASWITTARDCELWAGWRVRFPIDLESLPSSISFSKDRAYSLTDDCDRLLAFGQLLPRGSRAHLGRLIVDPETRGKGYGEVLVQALMQEARKEPFECLSLNVDIENTPAISLYLKLGFRDAARPSDEPASPESRYMERST